MSHCCKMMATNVEHKCEQHPSPFDCPDNLIIQNEKDYGIIVHDGGGSYVRIEYCPWCGTKFGDKVNDD